MQEAEHGLHVGSIEVETCTIATSTYIMRERERELKILATCLVLSIHLLSYCTIVYVD